jgi:hypothetical protein
MKDPLGRSSEKQLTLADIATPEEVFSLLTDTCAAGVSTTIGLTADRRTLIVGFFHDGSRYSWYIQTPDDWRDMILETSV